MFYKFGPGKLRNLIEGAIAKAGSERKLAATTGIPKASIHSLKSEKINLSSKYADKLCKYLDAELTNFDFLELLPDNWGRVKGGLALLKKSKDSGEFSNKMERLKMASSAWMKKWHKSMKEKEPNKYYLLQYERFKKIGNYKFVLANGVTVRNVLENKIGDFLIANLISFQYEPYLNINGKAYFPDFLCGRIIIEATEWRHPDNIRLQKLIKKCRDYADAGYFICFFIPNKYRKFYKELSCPIFSTLPELKTFINAPIAQTR